MVGSIMDKVIIDDAGNEILIKMPKEESDELKALHQEYLARKAILIAEQEAKEIAKETIYNKLGITAEEARLLLGGN
jgi:hypothetical protein